MTRNDLRLAKAAWVIIGFRLVAFVLASFVPFVHPHIIRQTDTMGVALRYWLRWTVEPELHQPLLPAVLTAGDYYGIATMEFPVLNLLMSPFFALDLEWARAMARLALLALLLALTYWHYKEWRKQEMSHLPVRLAALLVPVFSVAGLYIGKFMPDYLAFILCSLAVARSWDKPRYLSSFLLCALALLIKPPAVVALALFLLKPKPLAHLKQFFWMIPSVICSVLYYKLGLSYIRGQSDYPDYFYTELRPPLESLLAFFSEPVLLFDLLNNSVFPKFLFLVLLIAGIWQFSRERSWVLPKLWGILFLQIVGVAVLDGKHAYIHDYYFVGLSFTACLILAQTVKAMSSKVLVSLVIVVLGVSHLEKSWYEVRALFAGRPTLYEQCEVLRATYPDWPWSEGYHFRSPKMSAPRLGLCFGEIQNSKTAEYGFFSIEDQVPEGCAVVGVSRDLQLVECAEIPGS